MNWETVRLEDVCMSISDGDHQAPPKVDNGIPFVTISNINSSNKFDFSDVMFVPQEYYENLDVKRKPQKNDILYSVVGSFGIPVFMNIDKMFVFQRHIAILRPNAEKIVPKFLYYVMRGRDFYLQADSVAIGAAQRTVSLTALRNMTVRIPGRKQQKKISSILSAYDNLIENNQKQIKLLEEAAQRLYKEWFVDLRFPGHENVKIVDGVPEGWERCPIYDIAEYINGYAFKPCDWQDKGKPIIKIKEMNEGITKDTPRNIGEKIPDKYNIVAGDILFSWSATLSAMIWDLEDGILNQHIFKVIPKEDVCREYVLQSILQTLTEFNNLTTGATMKHIQRGKLKEVFVKLPCKKIMEKYRDIAEIQREAIISLRKKNAFLQEARDRLLPKLISGEIQV